jgi:hypothetical protein
MQSSAQRVNGVGDNNVQLTIREKKQYKEKKKTKGFKEFFRDVAQENLIQNVPTSRTNLFAPLS